jgi:hypothetical protein
MRYEREVVPKGQRLGVRIIRPTETGRDTFHTMNVVHRVLRTLHVNVEYNELGIAVRATL